jgi:hypothetical protein
MGHEADGYNETILPLDYQSRGQIANDVLWGSLVWPLPSGVRLTALMDCCHSGTELDYWMEGGCQSSPFGRRCLVVFGV